MDSATQTLYHLRDSLYQPPGSKFQALRFPVDGSALSLVVVETIDVDTPTLFHEPDLTPFWGENYRVDYRMLEFTDQRNEKFNGIYYRFKTMADDGLDANKHFVGAKGDVLIMKMHPLEFGRGAKALYEDVPEDWRRFEGLQVLITRAKVEEI
jgi:hypothetical protein